MILAPHQGSIILQKRRKSVSTVVTQQRQQLGFLSLPEAAAQSEQRQEWTNLKDLESALGTVKWGERQWDQGRALVSFSRAR